jgi:hypothetical protein
MNGFDASSAESLDDLKVVPFDSDDRRTGGQSNGARRLEALDFDSSR